MIVKEPYISSTSSTPLIKIYSNTGFLIQSKGLFYTEAILNNEEEIKNFTETTIGVPAPLANNDYICNTFIPERQNITQEQINNARSILNIALKSLSDEDAYQVKFLFELWVYNTQYNIGDRIVYNNELYNVLHPIIANLPPTEDLENYRKTNRPVDLIEEWNAINHKIYNTGDKVYSGNYLYESIIDNNVWSPQDFPNAWKLLGSQV